MGSPPPSTTAPGPLHAPPPAPKGGDLSKAGDLSKVKEWLRTGVNEKLLDVLATMIAPLCGSDPLKQPGKLRGIEAVQAALVSGEFAARAAGLVSHSASMAAARLEAESPFSLDLISDVSTRRIIQAALEKDGRQTMTKRDVKASEREQLEQDQAKMAASGGFAGARFLHCGGTEEGEVGLHPSLWGISKAQFSLFLEEVHTAIAKEKINNHTPEGCPPNPEERFFDPNHGPTCHQVNAWIVKLVTKEPRTCKPITGVSWSLKLNLHRGGLPCNIVFSHSFDDGIFDLGKRILDAWPDDCEGAFIAMLSVAQNFEVSPLVPKYATEGLHGSPVGRVLLEPPPIATMNRPKALIVLCSSKSTPLSRLWCCAEALMASRGGIASVTIEGATSDLLRGLEMAGGLQKAEEAHVLAKFAYAAAAMAQMEAAQTVSAHTDAKAKQAAQAKVDRRVKDAMQGEVEASRELARMQLLALTAKSSELLDFDSATCSNAIERAAIKEHFKRTNWDTSRRQIAAVVRKGVCGIRVADKDRSVVDGPLGPLRIDATKLVLGGKEHEMTQPTRVMHLATYLWSRPNVSELDVSSCQPLPPEVPRVICQALGSGMLPNLAIINLEGCAIPVRKVSGQEPADVIDMSGMRLGPASGLAIAAIVLTNTCTLSLKLGSNPLRDEAVSAIACALRNNPDCALISLDLSSTRFGVMAAKEVAITVRSMPKLTRLDITNNRICGVWVDQYGQQGTWQGDGVNALADAVRGSSTLSVLLLGGNRIRDEGVHAIVGALRDDKEITTLGLQNNEIGVHGAEEIATAVSAMRQLQDLNLSGNAICGVASNGGKQPLPYTIHGLTALIEAARVSPALRRLNLADNRLCGVWSDAFGSQQFGTYDPLGVETVADLLRSRTTSTLAHLDVSTNSIGPHGGRCLYEALRENEECPLVQLDVRQSRFDKSTERYLLEIAAARMPPLIIQT